ncbi:GNAT family N-acetyltransferase [Haloprofundus halobius]|uniref:GNAT family N-acetyltransferase n=1 Tax=Haloprofundus halobius TaxID=2876194 RepID=UPI001CCF7978|nr:GNAT family N-acetyltransferase [Haloprofundus halobius]
MTVSSEESHDPDERDERRSRAAANRSTDGETAPSDSADAPRTTTTDGGERLEPDAESAEHAAETAADTPELTLRRFARDDRDELRSLYERVTDERPDAAWFDRRFVDNPFNPDETPILVAEGDGELVGAHLSVAFRMRVGTTVVTALRTADILVHPNYREMDLADRLSAAAAERYADSPSAFAFDFLDGDEDALADALTFGYRVADDVPLRSEPGCVSR